MSDKLLPCPFCGSQVVISQEHKAHAHAFSTFIPDHHGSATIECGECCVVLIESTVELVRAAWNRRANLPSVLPISDHVGDASDMIDQTMDDLSGLVRQLVRALNKAAPDHALPAKAMDYLQRKGLQGSPLRSDAQQIAPQNIPEIIPREQPVEPEAQTIHEWFELTYAQFLTIPRVIMSAMPLDWQYKMTALLDEMAANWDWLPSQDRQYYVRVGDSVSWPYEDEEGNPIDPVLHQPDSDLCNYRHPHIEHRRKVFAAPTPDKGD